MSELAKTRNEIVKAAKEEFKTTMKQARDDLKSVFGVDSEDEDKDENEDKDKNDADDNDIAPE